MNVEQLLDANKIWYNNAGKDVRVSCLNPDHNDSDPSMRIDRISGVFGCFSCGFSGNIFTYYGESIDVADIRVQFLKKKIQNLSKLDVPLPLGREDFHRLHRNIKAETYKKFGAFTHESPEHEDRIVFPVYDAANVLVGCTGRLAFSDAEPKYKITPSGVQLPLHPAKPELYRDTVILVEGIFDMLNLYDKGITNVVCCFGKNLGDVKKKQKRATNLEKFLPMKIQGVKKVYILYDFGAAQSAKNLAHLLEEIFIVEVIEHPMFDKETDPGNITQEQADIIKEYIYEDSNSRQVQ
tara:strand:- start:547 stop:1431 length:885 start_codon:yes stop_codon:yes gene_type:complete